MRLDMLASNTRNSAEARPTVAAQCAPPPSTCHPQPPRHVAHQPRLFPPRLQCEYLRRPRPGTATRAVRRIRLRHRLPNLPKATHPICLYPLEQDRRHPMSCPMPLAESRTSDRARRHIPVVLSTILCGMAYQSTVDACPTHVITRSSQAQSVSVCRGGGVCVVRCAPRIAAILVPTSCFTPQHY
jgi:hypothetical protein